MTHAQIRSRDRYYYGSIPEGMQMHHLWYSEEYDPSSFVIITPEEHAEIHGKLVPSSSNGFDYEKYRMENKEHKSEYDKVYRSENREKISEYGKKYRNDNKEKISEYNTKYKEEHRKELCEKQKEYYEKNKEARKEYAKRYREKMKHREKLIALGVIR